MQAEQPMCRLVAESRDRAAPIQTHRSACRGSPHIKNTASAFFVVPVADSRPRSLKSPLLCMTSLRRDSNSWRRVPYPDVGLYGNQTYLEPVVNLKGRMLWNLRTDRFRTPGPPISVCRNRCSPHDNWPPPRVQASVCKRAKTNSSQTAPV